MTTNRSPLIDVQLVAWNGQDFLPECLRSLQAQHASNWKFWAIDNNSTDDSAILLKDFSVKLGGNFIANDSNVGFAKAHNHLAALGQAPYIFILNQDVVLGADYLKILLARMESDPSLGSTSGLLFQLNKSSAEPQKTTLIDSMGLRLSKSHRVVEQYRGQDITKLKLAGGKVEVFGVPATAALYRRRAVKSINYQAELFDEMFVSYKEDVDLAYRLQLGGWKSSCQINAVAYHERGLSGEPDQGRGLGSWTTIGRHTKRPLWQSYLSYRNHLYFIFGTSLASSRVEIFAWTAIYEKIKFLIILFTHPSLLYAWIEVWRKRKLLKQKRQMIRQRNFHPEEIMIWLNK